MKKYLLEGIGTALLVLFGCGIAVVSGVNLVATALAFGLVLFVLILVIGPATGCHVNPAVSFALALQKRISWKDAGFYILSQFIGGLVGAALVFLFVHGNGTGANAIQPILESGLENAEWLQWINAIVVECALTFVFVGLILVVTSHHSKALIVALSIGLALTLVHLLGIPLTGTSVNPARSFGPAIFSIFVGNGTTVSISQLIIFIVGPLAGAALAALATKPLLKKEEEKHEECSCCDEHKKECECAKEEEKHEECSCCKEKTEEAAK
ncbi:MAG: aquaporin [Acholeplasmatales bacterium]|jgi:aquaporin Z|nr:aquaporin [Acholeplasmatales bacterium]